MITIKEKEYFYEESDVFNFAEGLIGLPAMRRAVLLPLEEYAPFYWLVSVDDQGNRFIVVNPSEIYDDYKPSIPNAPANEKIKTLAIVKISSDWTKTTINLRAPIFINDETKIGSQSILTDSSYNLAESLPLN